MFLDGIKSIIDNCEVVSFDIFDTLLLRPYVNPNDLFAHLGFLNNIDNFKNIRWWAFLDARKKFCINNVDEVTLDEIYEFIPDEYKFMKGKELELELQILQQNPEMKEVWDYARSCGKKLIVVSDMYLPKDMLLQILAEKGFLPDEIFVSSEYKQLKAHSNLYKIVLSKLDIAADRILHIGDNLNADVEKARENGLLAVHYPKVIDRYFDSNPRVRDFYNKNKKVVSNSIMIGISALVLHRKNLLSVELSPEEYWYKIGVEYAGILAYSFMTWLNSQLKDEGINEALFVARDGYSLKKVLEIINPHIKSHYIYAPRILALAATLDLGKKFESGGFESITGVNALIKYFSEKYPEEFIPDVAEVKTDKDAYYFFRDNKQKLKEFAARELRMYENYLASLGIKNDKLAFVDMMTTFFTGHTLVAKALPEKEVKGFYYWIADFYKLSYKQKLKFERFASRNYDIPFVELLITSSEGPIVGIADNKPVYKSSQSGAELIRASVYPQIESGNLDFVKTICSIFKGLDIIEEDKNFILAWIDNFRFTPTPLDKTMFLQLCHAWEINHLNYKPIFPDWYKVVESPRKILTPAQKIFSVKNEDVHKVIRLLGIKIKLKRKIKK